MASFPVITFFIDHSIPKDAKRPPSPLAGKRERVKAHPLFSLRLFF
jgi:hypothetical protein